MVEINANEGVVRVIKRANESHFRDHEHFGWDIDTFKYQQTINIKPKPGVYSSGSCSISNGMKSKSNTPDACLPVGRGGVLKVVNIGE